MPTQECQTTDPETIDAETTDAETELLGQEDDASVDESEGLSRDQIFHMLQCHRRRLVLRYLQDHDGSVKMSDIAEHVAAVENDKTVATLRSQERQRVYIALYQAHLPKLDDAGVIEYQQKRGIVTRTELLDAFEPYLNAQPVAEDETTDDATETDSQPTPTGNPHTHYMYASGGSLLLLAGLVLNVPPLSVLPTVLLALAICAVFSVLSITHYLTGSTESNR